MTRKNEPTKVEAAKTAKKSTTRKLAGVAFDLSDDQIDQVSAGQIDQVSLGGRISGGPACIF